MTTFPVTSYTTAMRFADTNILLYAASPDPEETDKQQLAAELLTADDWALSVQVLQKFYTQATRPSRSWPLTHEQAVAFIEPLLRFPIQDVTFDLMRRALAIRVRFGLSYWDASLRLLVCWVATRFILRI